MARRAIKELFGEIASLRKELALLQQDVRVSLKRPRVELGSLIPDKPSASVLSPHAVDFIPMLDGILPQYYPSGGLWQSATDGVPDVHLPNSSIGVQLTDSGFQDHGEPGRAVADVPSAKSDHIARFGFREYYEEHFKSIDIHSLVCLSGQWKPLSDDQAMDRAAGFIKASDFESLLSLMYSSSKVADSVQVVVPLCIQQEEKHLSALESELADKQSMIEKSLQDLKEMRDRASRCLDNPSRRQEDGLLLREIENDIAGTLAAQSAMHQELDDISQQLSQKEVRIQMWKRMGLALNEKNDDLVRELQLQWHSAGFA